MKNYGQAVGTGEWIHLYRNGAGGWAFHSTVAGEAVRLWRERMVVVCGGARAEAAWYRLQEGRLGERFGESLSLDGEHLMIGAQGTVAGGRVWFIYRRQG